MIIYDAVIIIIILIVFFNSFFDSSNNIKPEKSLLCLLTIFELWIRDSLRGPKADLCIKHIAVYTLYGTTIMQS